MSVLETRNAAPPAGLKSRGDSVVDFDLHGALHVRLVDPRPADRRAVERILGPPGERRAGEADVTIVFTPVLRPAALTYLGYNELAFSDQHLYVLGRRDGRPKATVPVADLGDSCVIYCRHGLGEVPFLIDVINFTLLARGQVALHASAFHYEGQGVLVSGWTKGGKTETLLAFARRGAHYVGDEWVVVDGANGRIWGLPLPIKLWQWQLRQMGDERPPATPSERARIGLSQALVSAYRRRWRDPIGALHRILPTLERQLYLVRPPRALFGQRMAPAPVALDRVILALSHQSDTVVARRRAAVDLATPLIHTTIEEQASLYSAYRAYQFAFPGQRNLFLETAPARQLELLCSALQGKAGIELAHPYPVVLDTLYDAVQAVDSVEGQ